jgi:hypothetical protein
MNLSGLRLFCKKATCPPTTYLIQYLSEELFPTRLKRLERHLSSCDFCGAELQLLAKHPLNSQEEKYVTPVMPEHLRLLAKALLTDRLSSAEPFVELAYETRT